jgi:alpha-amylase
MTPARRRGSTATRAIAAVLSLAIVAACATPPPPSPAPSGAQPSLPGVTCGGPRHEQGWWNERVFYEVFVRSFADSDGDGIGDLRGLTDRLDYLNDGDPATSEDLGITGIWLMPIAEAASYHGYDVVDYRAVEQDYGTADDLRSFVTAARQRGIAVILDLVLNHTSDQHPWFLESRQRGSARDDWYLWADSDPGLPAWHAGAGQYYYGAFWSGMPDLNLENQDVTAELLDIARYWLDEFGIDGFRLDAIKHLIEEGAARDNTPATLAWLADFRAALKASHPDVLLVGEVFDITAASSAYVRAGAVDLTFDFPLARAMWAAPFLEDAAPLAGARPDALGSYPPGQYAAFLTNHDQNRVMSELNGNVQSAGLAAALLLTDPGVPFIYYGEEIGVRGRKPDERLRLPMPWDGTSPAGGFSSTVPWQPMGDDWPERNVAAQADDPGSLLSTYRSLVRLRTEHAALRTGAGYVVRADRPSISAFLRSTPEESILVLLNLGTEPVTDYGLTLAAGPLCGVSGARTVFGPEGLPAPSLPSVTSSGGFEGWRPLPEIAPQQALVISLSP